MRWQYYLGAFLLGTAVLVGFVIAFVVILQHNLRIRQARRAFARLPVDVIDEVLSLIETAAGMGESVSFLRLDAQPCENFQHTLCTSHVGGAPYSEDREIWPDDAKFLLQVRLAEPSLGPIWQGRLLTVFMVSDAQQVVRSYANACPDRYVVLEPKHEASPCILLKSIRVPAEADPDEPGHATRFPVFPARLCEIAPSLRRRLRPYSIDVPGLVTQILCPNIYAYNFEEQFIAYIGGDPMLIQNPHDPVCDECAQPMRFLFQFGEIIPAIRMADGGVCYVYGCDAHPHCCKAFIDSH